MKIALIHPKISYSCENKEIENWTNSYLKDSFSQIFNLNLLRIAGITPEEHEVTLIDESHQVIDYEKPFDVVGVTAMTYQAEHAYEIADKFKGKGCQTIMGGIHATVVPQEAGRHFDSVCVGEVENIWEPFLEDVQNGKPKKYYEGENVDLKKISSPKFSMVKDLIPEYYQQKLWLFPLMTTRGCPRGCDYCSATYIYHKHYRKKEIGQVLHEVQKIKQTADELKISNYLIEICDDNFTIDLKRAKRLLSKLIKEKISYTVSLDIAASEDQELLELLKASGCKIVSVGIESLETDILDDLGQWKKSQLRKVEKNIEAYFKYGIIPSGNFMVGSDGTTPKVFENLDRFLERFPIVYNLLFFTPFPGTPYAETLEKEGRLRKGLSWKHYNLFNVVFETKKISRKELYDGFLRIRTKYDQQNQQKRLLKYIS